MESVVHNVVHSRQPNKVSVTLSGKINNGGFSYDDVYGGPPPRFGVSSLSPRFEDYGEIFGSFKNARSSSIPLLDLPVVDETDAFFDPRSSAFNYGEVFGALDFAVSFEDLVDQPNVTDGVSSEDAWTPAEIDSFSGESDHSLNNQSMSNGDIFQSVYGSTEFGISYHKVNGTGNEHMLKEETHMNQLHAVPGHPLVYDESTQLSRNDPSFQVTDDIDLDMDFSADKVHGNHRRKTVPHLPNFTSGEQAFGSDLNLHNECSRNGSHSSEMFITVSDVGLRSMPSPVPPPSRPPPVLDAKKGDMCGYFSNNRWVASKEIPSDNSPPFFDVEVDMTSSAAPSAAAMQETMHGAEARLWCAKEYKERKKGVYLSHVKSSYDAENNDAKMNKNMTRLNSSNDEAVLETCDRRHSKTKISVTDERQKSRKGCTETLDTLEGKIILNMLEVKHMKVSGSSQDSDRGTEVGTWKEETELFELVGTEEYGKVIQPTKHSKILVQDTRTHEYGQKETEASNMQEYKKVKSIEKNYQVEEYEKNSKAAKEAYEHDKTIRRSKASNDECRQRKQEENEKNTRKVYQHGKIEKIVTEPDLRSLEDLSEMQNKEHKQAEKEKSKERQTPSEVQLGVRLKENEKKLREAEKQQQSVKKQNQFEQMIESGKRPTEAFSLGQAEDEENLKDSVELEDIDERSNEAFKQDKTDEIDACKGEEIEKTLKGCSKNEESDKGLKHAPRWEENEKRLKEEFELEVNEIRMKEAFRWRENDRRENWAYERDQNQKKLEEVRDEYRGRNRLKEAGDDEGIQKVLNQAPEKEWSGGILNEVQMKKEIESSLNEIFDREGSVKVSNEGVYPEQSENMVKDVGRKENDKGLHKDLDQMEGNKEEEIMKFAKATDKTWEVESEENLLAAQLASTFAENIGKLEVSQESVVDQKIGKTVTECKVGEKKLEETGVENQLANENIGAPEMTTRNAEHSAYQSGKVDGSVKKADDRRSIEAAEPATVQESVNVQQTTKWLHVGQSTERKENNVGEAPATVVEDPERMRREIEAEKDRLRHIEEQKDRERERDRIAVDKAMLEAEREREREKDRMAVDRATLEARDRAYAEACERAQRAAFERATVEARQIALAEARGRLEKACAEARSYTDKATTEARLKAERAAVERATAEAQEHATEKLKVERAVFESRERLERSVSDKFGVCSTDMLDPQFQNFSSSTGTNYPYSVYGASSFTGRSEREGESAQRCRARLERHRRTAERAAKALAEKNMRDLLVQKEQAERNRLAETLDAEVRRWSSGKEGNLRALLSTLQYILGPDCGWQSIPLTEVITSAAVKKAYRKATLCVHPDKLQQRGASIQHKYICEKVFDLLKDAWNKFNSEER